MNEDWDVLDPNNLVMDMVITDVGVLAKKERVPAEYTLIEQTNDSKKADFPEGMLGMTRRYLCYTRKVPSPTRGRVAVTELKVISANDRPPIGYLSLFHTLDDNTKAFSSKQLLAKFTPLEQATRAVTDVVVLSAAKKEDVPPKYTRLPEINGFSICYRVGDLPKREAPPPASSQLQPNQLSELQRGPSVMVKRVRSAIDGLQFELKDEKDTQQYIVQFALGDLKLLTLDDVEAKFEVDLTQSKSIANLT